MSTNICHTAGDYNFLCDHHHDMFTDIDIVIIICRYCKGSVMNECTGGRLITPHDHGAEAIPRYTFSTGPIPEPSPYKEDIYGCPVPAIDCRAISFEIQRRSLSNVLQQECDSDFDLLDVLESDFLQNSDPIIPTLKDKIQALSPEDRAALKQEILKANQWVTEFVPTTMACLACNSAGSYFTLPFCKCLIVFVTFILWCSISNGFRIQCKINICVLCPVHD